MPASPPPPPPQAGWQPPGPGQPGQPGPAGWVPAPGPPDHPDATRALVLGLVALVGGLACLLPLVVGPFAWAVGRRALRDIDAQPGRWGGRNQATAGYVTGVVATVLLVLGVVAVAALVVVLAVGTASVQVTTDASPATLTRAR